MKKQNFLLLAAAIISLGFASCNPSYKTKEVSLKTQEDSLNYYLGYGNGSGIKDQYFQKDSSDKAINDFVAKLEKSFKNKDEMVKMGTQFGEYLKQMEKAGLTGDSTVLLNSELVKQGLMNGMKEYKEGMTVEQANKYLQETMQKIQQKKMANQVPPAPPAQPQQRPEPQEGGKK